MLPFAMHCGNTSPVKAMLMLAHHDLQCTKFEDTQTVTEIVEFSGHETGEVREGMSQSGRRLTKITVLMLMILPQIFKMILMIVLTQPGPLK